MPWSKVNHWLAKQSGIGSSYRPRSLGDLERRIRDYVDVGLRLFWQRNAMYFGAFVLAVAYYDVVIGVYCYLGILLSECFDHLVAKRISEWDESSPRKARKYYRLIVFGTALNSVAIGTFIVIATLMEGTSPHFTPLLFLFAAALFAAMNTHQIFMVLTLRLAIYASLFLFVALVNIIEIRPALSSIHWLHFFTVIFVLYFILDCSFVFLRLYRRNLTQIEELRLEHERAMAAYEAKSQFLSVVSHELRTPITSIKGPLNLICSGVIGPVPENLRQMLNVANRNSDRLASLIDDLLDLQALDTGKMALHYHPVRLAELLRDATEATGGYLREKQVSISTGTLDESIIVVGDEKRLMQVMANILSNAIKFSEDRGVVDVSLSVKGNSAIISVRDYGRGIPPDSEDKVFGEFSQIDSSDVRKVGGTGLGMSISRRILAHHNGSIEYDSALGKGSTFYVTLPVHADEPGKQLLNTAAGR